MSCQPGDEVVVGSEPVTVAQQVGRLLLARDHVRLVLDDAIERVAVLDDGRVDHAATRAALDVDPRLRVAERHEVARRGVHHPLVRRVDVAACRAGRRVERGRPVDDVLAGVLVVVRLRRPRVAREVRRHLDVTLVGPVHEVGGLPDLEVLAAGLLRLAEVDGGVRLEVGREQVEPVALVRADDERIAQTLGAELRGQDGLAVVELVVVERVVALAGAHVDLLAVVRALAGEVRERVRLEVERRRGRLDRHDDLAGVGRAVERAGRGEGDLDGVGAVRRAVHLTGRRSRRRAWRTPS